VTKEIKKIVRQYQSATQGSRKRIRKPYDHGLQLIFSRRGLGGTSHYLLSAVQRFADKKKRFRIRLRKLILTLTPTLKATMPTISPAAKKQAAIISQIKPQTRCQS